MQKIAKLGQISMGALSNHIISPWMLEPQSTHGASAFATVYQYSVT